MSLVQWNDIPIMYFPIGGRYCSMTIVDGRNALVLDLRIARTETPGGPLAHCYDVRRLIITVNPWWFTCLPLCTFPESLRMIDEYSLISKVDNSTSCPSWSTYLILVKVIHLNSVQWLGCFMVVSGWPHSLCFGSWQLSHGYDFRIARHFCRAGWQKTKPQAWHGCESMKSTITLFKFILAMDNREDHPRVSVGTVQDWQKLKSYYRAAFIQAITQIASTQGLAREQNVAIAHMDQVHFSLNLYRFQILNFHSGLNGHLITRNQTYA